MTVVARLLNLRCLIFIPHHPLSVAVSTLIKNLIRQPSIRPLSFIKSSFAISHKAFQGIKKTFVFMCRCTDLCVCLNMQTRILFVFCGGGGFLGDNFHIITSLQIWWIYTPGVNSLFLS